MSFASMVSSVIEVPVDPELGRRADLAGLDRRDLVLGRGEDACRRPMLMYAAPGWTRTPGLTAVTTIAEDHDRTIAMTAADGAGPAAGRAAGRALRRRARADTRSSDGDPALTRGQAATRTGDPSSGISTNGTSRLPAIAPDRVRPRAGRPDPRRRARPRQAASADDAGNATPSARSSPGRTTSSDEPSSATERVERLVRRRCWGATEDEDKAERSRATAATIWLAASSRIGSPSRVRRTAKSTAPMRDADAGRSRGSS